MPTSSHVADLGAFVLASPSSFHAAAEVANRLVAHGFVRQDEAEPWDSSPGGHVLVREGAVIAWRVPEGNPDRFLIVGAHTDSPSLKLKPLPNVVSAGYAQAAMEIYGGPLLNSWLDREFGLAGRLVTRDGARLVRTPAWLRIAQLAPHMDRSVNENLHLDRQAHMMPLLGLAGGRDLLAAVAEAGGVDPGEVLGHDLFAYVTEAPAVFGIDGDLLASSRMDNLSSVHAGLAALLSVPSTEAAVQVLACFDHEEIGSATATGASGPLLQTVLRRIAAGLGIAGDPFDRVLGRSVQVSADAGNAVHPNYAGLHDPQHQPTLNAGPLLKMSATQRYTTDGVGVALWRTLAERVGAPVQYFVSHNAVPSGSTIGPLSATRLGIKTLDVGIPLLSMHSTRELAGVRDLEWLATVLAEFYRGDW